MQVGLIDFLLLQIGDVNGNLENYGGWILFSEGRNYYWWLLLSMSELLVEYNGRQ